MNLTVVFMCYTESWCHFYTAHGLTQFAYISGTFPLHQFKIASFSCFAQNDAVYHGSLFLQSSFVSLLFKHVFYHLMLRLTNEILLNWKELNALLRCVIGVARNLS